MRSRRRCCSASVPATEREALRVPHSRIPTQAGNLQPVSHNLSSFESKRSSETNKEEEKKKGAQSIRFEPLIESAVTASYSPVTVSLTFPFPWCFPVFPSFSLTFSSFASFFFLPPSHSLPIHSLACSWTEWASTALRNPVSMAVWASKQVSRIL